MSDTSTKPIPDSTPTPKRRHHPLRVIIISLLSVIGVCIAFVVGVALWLTPQRLTRLVNENAGKYLDADLSVSKIDYTLWSTFPTLHLSIDSLNINSRSLDAIDPKLRQQLPADASFLLSASEIRGSLNLWNALHNQIRIDSINAGKIHANIVMVNDSVANYNILQESLHPRKPIHLTLGPVHVAAPIDVSLFSLPTHTDLHTSLNYLNLNLVTNGKTGAYASHIILRASATGRAAGVTLPRPINLALEGNMAINLKPLSVSTTDMAINTTGISLLVNLDFSDNDRPVINSLSADISTRDVAEILTYIPAGYLSPLSKYTAMLSKYDVNLPLSLNLSLDAPYPLPDKLPSSSDAIPPFTAKLAIPGASLKLPSPMGGPIKIKNLILDALLAINPEDSSSNRLDISRLSVGADGLTLAVKGGVHHLLDDNPDISADLRLNANLNKMEASLLPSGMSPLSGKISADSHIEAALKGISSPSLQRVAVKGSVSSDRLAMNQSAGGEKALITGLRLKYKGGAKNGTSGLKGNILLKADSAYYAAPGTSLALKDVGLNVAAALRSTPFSPSSTYPTAPSSPDDSILSARIPHSPLYLIPTIPDMMQTALSMADAKVSLQVNSGSFSTDAYPTDNFFSSLNLSTDLDSLSIHSMALKVGSTKGSLSAEVAGLRNFLTSSSPAELKAVADMDFDRVDINRLTAAYYEGVAKLTGKPADYTVPPIGKPTAADSLCIVIPRNLSADVRLHSDKANYMQWEFAPLSTTLSTHDGNARIGNLSIGADYAKATVDWTYFTHDLNNIHMDIDVDVDDFSFPEFSKAFPSLAAKAPELDDIAGSINLDVDGSFLMFPDMYLNTHSMQGRFSLHGDGMNIARTEPELKRITKFMLIKGDSIPVSGLDVSGSFHDNLLQIDPFTLKCGPYSLLIGGVNNLRGEMYYHAGLLHSPFHLPFGVNIVGNWRHPAVRFGGKGIKDGREREIAANLDEDVDVNIMTYLQHGWLEFVAAAAKYYAETSDSYVSTTE